MLADKLREAGYPVARDRLYVAAVDCLRLSNGELAKATQPFIEKLRADKELMLELLRPALITAAIEYLKRRKLDMSAGVTVADGSSGSDASGGQSAGVQQDHPAVAAVNSSDEDLRGDAGNGPLGCVPSQELAGGPSPPDTRSDSTVPHAREPTLSEAAKILRRAPGSGALRPTSLEEHRAIRGESWLLRYAIPDGPQILDLTWYNARKMEERLFKEGGQRILASVVLAALRKEKEKLGQVSDDEIIRKTFATSPATLAKIADQYEPDRVYEKGRALLRQFQRDELTSAGGADAS